MHNQRGEVVTGVMVVVMVVMMIFGTHMMDGGHRSEGDHRKMEQKYNHDEDSTQRMHNHAEWQDPAPARMKPGK